MTVDVVKLNSGIRNVVTWFNSMGLSTVDSGDGDTHDYECDRPYPYVSVKSHPSELVSMTDRLRTILDDFGIPVVPVGEEGVWIQANYDPSNRVALIDVAHLTDDMLPEDLET